MALQHLAWVRRWCLMALQHLAWATPPRVAIAWALPRRMGVELRLPRRHQGWADRRSSQPPEQQPLRA
eukprot:7285453-Prymnesium_polylepis.1